MKVSALRTYACCQPKGLKSHLLLQNSSEHPRCHTLEVFPHYSKSLSDFRKIFPHMKSIYSTVLSRERQEADKLCLPRRTWEAKALQTDS